MQGFLFTQALVCVLKGINGDRENINKIKRVQN